MALKTSEAFVIDVRKMQEADRLVTFFTQNEGKVRGVAPSAANSRKRFGGKLERLSRVRVTYFEKEGRDLSRIDSCDLLEESFTLHQDLGIAATLSYVAEVVDTFAREREPDGNYFRLVKSLLAAFRKLRPGADCGPLARYFEIWTLRLHGLLPDLDRCAECEKPLARRGAAVEVSDLPRALCGACRPARARAHKLSPEALAALDSFRTMSPQQVAERSFTAGAMSQIEQLAGAILQEFVGHPFRSRRFLTELGLVRNNP